MGHGPLSWLVLSPSVALIRLTWAEAPGPAVANHTKTQLTFLQSQIMFWAVLAPECCFWSVQILCFLFFRASHHGDLLLQVTLEFPEVSSFLSFWFNLYTNFVIR